MGNGFVEILVENIEQVRDNIGRTIDNYIYRLNRAEENEEILWAKRELLINIVDELPLSSEHCYFCLINDDICEDCEYAEEHGICGKQKENSWDKVRDAQVKLRNIIRNEY